MDIFNPEFFSSFICNTKYSSILWLINWVYKHFSFWVKFVLFSESFYKLCFLDRCSGVMQNQVSLHILIFRLIEVNTLPYRTFDREVWFLPCKMKLNFMNQSSIFSIIAALNVRTKGGWQHIVHFNCNLVLSCADNIAVPAPARKSAELHRLWGLTHWMPFSLCSFPLYPNHLAFPYIDRYPWVYFR